MRPRQVQLATVRRAPLLNRLVWRLNEAGLRGAALAWRIVPPDRVPAGQLLKLPDGCWTINDHRDHVARQLCHGGYERAERWACRQLIRPGGLVLDVGANYGVYTQLASKQVGRSGCVIAFEPGPALPVLRSIVQVAELSNVEIVPCAVGRQAGRATMTVPGDQPGLATLRQAAEIWDSRGVEVVRLDGCVAVPHREIDLIKIDSEGLEAEVLEGAERLFDQQLVRAALVEVSPQFGPIDYLAAFATRYSLKAYTLGYQIGLTYRPRSSPYDQNLVHDQVNALLLRSDVRLA